MARRIVIDDAETMLTIVGEYEDDVPVFILTSRGCTWTNADDTSQMFNRDELIALRDVLNAAIAATK